MFPSLQPHGLQHTPGLPVLHHLPEFSQIHVHWVDDTIQSSHFLMISFLLPSIFPSIRVFCNDLALRIRWPKYWSFSFSISPLNEYSGLISFKIDWFDFHAVQRTLKSLLQHYSSKASILQCSAFFMVQLSQPYMTPGKTTALTMWTFVGKVMSLASLVAQMVKNLPAVQEMWLSPCVGTTPWRKKWQVTSVFLPGWSHGQRSLQATVHGVENKSDIT